MKDKTICEVIEETITKTNCPQCQTILKSRWLVQEEQEKLTFDFSDPQFRDGSELSQVEVYFCPNCAWQSPSLLIKAEYENISASEEKQKYQKERELVEKIATFLLTQKDIKIRFVKSIIFENEKKMGRTFLFKIPELNREISCVCLFIEEIVNKDKTQPGLFCDVLAHELAHAEVFKNPQHNPKENHRDCSCRKPDFFFNPHTGNEHDKIWHDKYDEFRERIKNEKLAKGSDYETYGIDFQYGKIEKSENIVSSDEDKERILATTQDDKSIKTILIIGGIFLALVFFTVLFYFLIKKRKNR
ncbi:hypothetical protein [endosymbiont GvMRE of Glomus versiforme]|uniref:hypothetical protein n=1 Tax=endosymbiont GvMRE of Glomus versiforme TaxID=2039283 RepID=UPI000EED0F3B|nr:hypothetical protein [endosymbiont GvMRE of Glomus versiforme]RHZ37789.1 hypothetical protein GvMRE_I1g254 [endosymbiont GvMRE of Glomus versiforme]